MSKFNQNLCYFQFIILKIMQKLGTIKMEISGLCRKGVLIVYCSIFVKISRILHFNKVKTIYFLHANFLSPFPSKKNMQIQGICVNWVKRCKLKHAPCRWIHQMWICMIEQLKNNLFYNIGILINSPINLTDFTEKNHFCLEIHMNK